MLVMSLSGAYLASIKPDTGTAIMGLLTFYLVTTAWMTVIRREGQSGPLEIVAMLVALAIAAGAFASGLEAADSVTGVKHGYPPVFYSIVAGIASLLALGDFRVIARRGSAGAQRLFAPVLLVIGTTVFWLIRVRRRA